MAVLCAEFFFTTPLPGPALARFFADVVGGRGCSADAALCRSASSQTARWDVI